MMNWCVCPHFWGHPPSSFSRVARAREAGVGTRHAFIFLTLLICLPVRAEWQFLGATSDGTAYLVDPATKTKRGQLVEMATLQNLRAARRIKDTEFRSAVGKTLYNCNSRTSATTLIRQFSGERGEGKLVSVFKQKPNEIIWDAILPNTILEREWQIACDVR